MTHQDDTQSPQIRPESRLRVRHTFLSPKKRKMTLTEMQFEQSNKTTSSLAIRNHTSTNHRAQAPYRDHTRTRLVLSPVQLTAPSSAFRSSLILNAPSSTPLAQGHVLSNSTRVLERSVSSSSSSSSSNGNTKSSPRVAPIASPSMEDKRMRAINIHYTEKCRFSAPYNSYMVRLLDAFEAHIKSGGKGLEEQNLIKMRIEAFKAGQLPGKEQRKWKIWLPPRAWDAYHLAKKQYCLKNATHAEFVKFLLDVYEASSPAVKPTRRHSSSSSDMPRLDINDALSCATSRQEEELPLEKPEIRLPGFKELFNLPSSPTNNSSFPSNGIILSNYIC